MNTHRERVEAACARWNAGDLEGYLEIYDDGVQLHGFGPTSRNKAQVKEFYQLVWDAFGSPPPLEILEMLVDGHLCCCRYVMTGVHNGPFMGVAPTGKPIALRGIIILRFSGHRIVERWSSADFLSLLVQIGGVTLPAG